jgi:hypothetical protein
MPTLKTFPNITLADNECWSVYKCTTWSDKVAWDWTIDGVPPGLTSEDELLYSVYKVTPRVQYVLTLVVDKTTLTDDARAYYGAVGFAKEDIKARMVPGTFETLVVPDGAFLFNTKGLVVQPGTDITTTLTLTLDYTGPMHVHSVALNSEASYISVIDVSQFAWTGTRTDGETADVFQYYGGTYKLGSSVYTIAAGELEMPVEAGVYTVVVYIDTASGTVEESVATSFPVGSVPLYMLRVNAGRIIEVKNYRSWAGAILHELMPDLQGGQSDEHYHLTHAQWSALGTAASLNLDQTTPQVTIGTFRFPDVSLDSSGTITRDENGRISTITRVGGRTLTITRDGNNRISSIADGTKTWTIARDGTTHNITGWTVT